MCSLLRPQIVTQYEGRHAVDAGVDAPDGPTKKVERTITL